MTAAEPLDPERLAAILAEHERHWQSHGSTLCLGGREYADAEHCLPYRLAAEVERLQAQEQRTRDLLDDEDDPYGHTHDEALFHVDPDCAACWVRSIREAIGGAA